MVLDYQRSYPACHYLFLSSGAAYGSNFKEPATFDTLAIVAINSLSPQESYGVAKLHTECRHRSHTELSIIDIRAIRDKKTLKTSPEYIVRDFLHPSDFYKLVSALLLSPATSAVVDAY
jgi:hypothetical protein